MEHTTATIHTFTDTTGSGSGSLLKDAGLSDGDVDWSMLNLLFSAAGDTPSVVVASCFSAAAPSTGVDELADSFCSLILVGFSVVKLCS